MLHLTKGGRESARNLSSYLDDAFSSVNNSPQLTNAKQEGHICEKQAEAGRMNNDDVWVVLSIQQTLGRPFCEEPSDHS